jgi:tetratricopeptide (TPR) repeat protein
MRILLATAFLAAVSATGAARASPFGRAAQNQARQLADEATGHYRKGEFAAALVDYRHAYEVAPAPELLFNIAQCHFQLKRYTWAIFFYQGYIDRRPRAPNRALVRSLIAESRQQLRSNPRPAVALVSLEQRPLRDPPPRPPALYRRWWFWAAVGAAAVAVGGTAVYLSSDSALPDRRGMDRMR